MRMKSLVDQLRRNDGIFLLADHVVKYSPSSLANPTAYHSKVFALLNQSQGGMCICLGAAMGLGVWRECLGP